MSSLASDVTRKRTLPRMADSSVDAIGSMGARLQWRSTKSATAAVTGSALTMRCVSGGT